MIAIPKIWSAVVMYGGYSHASVHAKYTADLDVAVQNFLIVKEIGGNVGYYAG